MTSRQGFSYRRPRQDAGRIQGRQRRDAIVNQQWYLGTTEHDGVAALVTQPSDYLLEVGAGLIAENAIHQLVHDDGVDARPLFGIGHEMFNTSCRQLFRMDWPFHRVLGSRDGQLLEATLLSFGRYFFHNVQPWQRRTRRN